MKAGKLSDKQLYQIEHANAVKADDQLATILREAAVGFLAADAGGDGELDFEDFKKLVPNGSAANEAMLYEAFKMADSNGNGKISKTEYFLWTLNVATRSAGMGSTVDKQFRQTFDKSGDGKLNMVEFVEAAEEFGFGSCAHDIFLELDQDESGLVSFQEIHEHLKAAPQAVSDECKKFLTALSFDWCSLDADKVGRTPWCVDTPSALRDTTNARLAKDFVKVSDLWTVMQIGAKTKAHIKRPDFLPAMAAVGFSAQMDGHNDMLFDIFDEVLQIWRALTILWPHRIPVSCELTAAHAPRSRWQAVHDSDVEAPIWQRLSLGVPSPSSLVCAWHPACSHKRAL